MNSYIYLFIDSNLFIGAKYRFSDFQFRKLFNLMNRNSVKLLNSDIIRREVEQHIKVDLDKQIELYNRAYDACHILDKYYGYKKVKVNDSVSKVINEFNTFLTHRNAHQLDINTIDVNTLVNRYFEKIYPFTDKKPNEFKDAINILALQSFAENITEPIYILSNDKGFCMGLDSNRFTIFSKFRPFFEAINSITDNEQAIYTYIEDIFRSKDYRYVEFCKYIKKNLDIYVEDDFDRNLSFLDVENFELKNLEIEKDSILYDNDSKEANFDVEFDIAVAILYRDESNSIWDKEDGKYIYSEEIILREIHHCYIEMMLDIGFDEESAVEFEILTDYMQLDLSDSTMILCDIVNSLDNDLEFTGSYITNNIKWVNKKEVNYV